MSTCSKATIARWSSHSQHEVRSDCLLNSRVQQWSSRQGTEHLRHKECTGNQHPRQDASGDNNTHLDLTRIILSMIVKWFFRLFWTSWFQEMCCSHKRNWFVGEFAPPFPVSESHSTSWISLENTLNSPRSHLLNKVLLAHTILHKAVSSPLGQMLQGRSKLPVFTSPFQASRVESMTSKLPLLNSHIVPFAQTNLLGPSISFSNIFDFACETGHHPAGEAAGVLMTCSAQESSGAAFITCQAAGLCLGQPKLMDWR